MVMHDSGAENALSAEEPDFCARFPTFCEQCKNMGLRSQASHVCGLVGLKGHGPLIYSVMFVSFMGKKFHPFERKSGSFTSLPLRHNRKTSRQFFL